MGWSALITETPGVEQAWSSRVAGGGKRTRLTESGAADRMVPGIAAVPAVEATSQPG